MKYPVKFPVVLAILSVFVAPLLSVLYAGLIAMDFSGWLKIFDPVRTVLDLVQAGLFLCFTLGTLFLLWSLRRYVKNGDAKNARALLIFFRLFTVVSLALVPVTVLYSLFPENILLCLLWSIFFSITLLSGICLAIIYIRISKAINNKWIFVFGLIFLCAQLFDYSGFRTFETVLLHVLPTGEDAFDSVDISNAIWGVSSIEYEMMDDETRADMEEVSLFGMHLLRAFGMLFVVVHSACLGMSYVILAVLFAQKNKANTLAKDL